MAVVLVTGCSSGFGLATAARFAARGDRVVGTMRDLTRRGDLDRAVADVADRLDVVQLDVTDAGSRAAAVETTLTRYGRLDILVNNARGQCPWPCRSRR